MTTVFTYECVYCKSEIAVPLKDKVTEGNWARLVDIYIERYWECDCK